VVDQINATVFGGAGREWAAQLVPGVDGTLPSTYLAYQSQDIVCATTNTLTTVTSAALFADVAEGMKVTGTGIPAGAYVKSKASNSSLTLSTAATATGAPTLTFAVDTGDGGIVSATDTGNVRAYNGAYYVVLPFKQTYLDTFETATRDFIVTGGGPSHAANAANSFYVAVGNRRSAPSAAGVLMGGAPLRVLSRLGPQIASHHQKTLKNLVLRVADLNGLALADVDARRCIWRAGKASDLFEVHHHPASIQARKVGEVGSPLAAEGAHHFAITQRHDARLAIVELNLCPRTISDRTDQHDILRIHRK